MEVAQLTATLSAEIAGFERNLAAADALIAQAREHLRGLERSSMEASAALGRVKASPVQAVETAGVMDAIKRSVSGVTGTAMRAADQLHEVKLGTLQAAETAANAEIEKRALKSVEEQAIKTRIATGGGNDRTGFAGTGLIGGILPGGRRASAGAVTTAIGLGLAAAPGLAPGLVGVAAAAAPAALESLVGGALSLKLAFADLTAAAFTQQKAFDLLTPAQQGFVQSLRSLDAGFVKPLERLAQQSVLLRLEDALHRALTPQAVGVARSAVDAFGGAVGGGAQQFGSLVGSKQFLDALGPVLQADARYLRDFVGGMSNLFDALVHLQQAAIPFTDWLDKGLLGFTQWADRSVKAAQASGELAHFFDMARESLQALGTLLGSVGHLSAGLFEAVGFENSLGVIRLIATALNGIGSFLQANRQTFNDFFAGALQSAHDMLVLIHGVAAAITPLLTAVNGLAHGLGGWRTIIDILIAYKFATIMQGWALALARVGTAAKVATTAEIILNGTTVTLGTTAAATTAEVGGLRGALLALGGADIAAGLTGLLGPLSAIVAVLASAGDAPSVTGNKGVAAVLQGLVGSGEIPTSEVMAAGKQAGVGDQPFGTALKNPDFVAILDAYAKAHHLYGSSGGSHLDPNKPLGPQMAAIAAAQKNFPLPKGIQDQILAAQAGHGDLDKANEAAYAYYENLLKRHGLSRGQRNAIYTAETPYAPSPYGTPPPLTGAGNAGQVLPPNLQRDLAKAGASPGTSDDIRTINAAIAYLDAHMKTFSVTKQTDAFNEIKSLHDQLKTIQGAGATSVVAGPQQALAQAMTSFVSGTGPGTTPKQQMQAADHLLKVATAQKAVLETDLKTAANAKERLAISNELLAVERDITRAKTAQANAEKAQKAAIASGQIDKILGLGPQAVPGVQALATRERQILLAATKAAGVTIPGAVNEPLSKLIKDMQHSGIQIPKSTLDSLQKINESINTARKEHTKLTSAQSQNISARLVQINDTLKTLLGGKDTGYRVPTEKQLTAGLTGLTADQRRQIGERLAEVAELGGKIPTVGAAMGIPLTRTASGKLVPAGSGVTQSAPELVSEHGGVRAGVKHAPPTLTSEHGKGGGNVIIHVAGDMPINVSGEHKNPAQIAAATRNEILKTARRNPTQTRGPNAGRNVGMN